MRRFKRIKFQIANTYTGRYICNEKLAIINFDAINEAVAFMTLHHLSRDIFQIVTVKTL